MLPRGWRREFLTVTLIVHRPDPVTGMREPTRDRFREALDNGLLAGELGYDGFGVRELLIATITHDHADRVRSRELLVRERRRRGHSVQSS
ncbi:hypothetical protein ABZ614_34295 [Streptomyces sp. NPDC013178]|uniref:hypothetical protein n=1 Tax=Streptomyces sp. NPDC013178 TaxID=3155118 RepID=UPI0033D4ECB2